MARSPDQGSPVSVRPTPGGLAVLWGACLVTLLGLLRISAPLLIAGVLTLLLWWACRVLAGRHLAGIRAERVLPPRAWADRSLAVETTLENGAARLAARDFAFADPIATTRTREVTTLSPGTSLTLAYPARFPRRGRIRPRSWSARSDWPLGWFESSRTGDFSRTSGGADSILVLPNPFLPPDLATHLDAWNDEASLWNGFPEPAAEFRLLREFRHGDPVRAIAWPASLRSGVLHVREPDPPRPAPPRYGVVLQSYRPAGEMVTPESFETILRIVAGLLYRFRSSRTEVLFASLPGEPVPLRSRSDFSGALDSLATLARTPLSSLEPLAAAAPAFASCDEVFVLGDAPRGDWEAEAKSVFGNCHCIDAHSLHLAVRRAPRRRPAIAS